MTQISIIAGVKRRQGNVGWFQSAPDPTNADSQPPLSETDAQWGCEDWKQWHTANVNKYGKDQANQKFLLQFNQLSTWNSAYSFCRYNCDWAQYFGNYGIDVGDVFSHAACSAVTVIDNAGNIVTNTTSGLSTTSSILKWALPLAAIVGGVWAVDKYVYPIFPKKKAAVSGIKRRRK
jgi:hypothetical protein